MLIEKEYLTVQEAAAILNIGAVSIYRELHNEKITALKAGRYWRIPAEAFSDYVETATVKKR